MSKKLKTLCALVCAVFLLVSPLCSVCAADSDTADAPAEVVTYMEIPIYEFDKYIGTGLKIGELTYVPLLAFCQSMLDVKCRFTWDSDSNIATISAPDLELSVCTDERYMTVNGRCIYLPEGVYNINGTVVVPIRQLAEVFGTLVLWNDDWSVDLLAKKTSIISPAEEFYNAEDLYWLSHVIYAESGNQSLEGMIAVGNVVLNRAHDQSGSFPDSIYEVIFQSGQFSVVDSGSIYLEPNELSIVAAKLCLEGVNISGDSLFFLNPDISSDYWFRTNRTFVMGIGDHDFYA